MVQQSDINFRTLANEVNIGIFVCNPTGTFIYANLALADIFGFENPADIVGRNFGEFFSPDNDKGQVFMNHFRKAMLPGTNSLSITTEINGHDGKTALVEVNLTPFNKNRELLGCQGVVLDITKRTQEENKMKYTSTHDSLTGIYNLTFFEAEMKRLERGRQFPISIIVVIVGGLQHLSESKTHEDGVKLIKRVAHRLFRTLRGDEIVARIGEDEFAILLPSVDENIVDVIIKRVRGNLMEINTNESKPALEFYIGASTAKSGERLSTVLNRAEVIANLDKKRIN